MGEILGADLKLTYPPGTTDFSAILNKVKEAKPDLLVANYIPNVRISRTS
jgi:ABC-type branched-subunit amino acid transport system substrate-binding protein